MVPYTPLIFQGQEWAASTPFLYFTDHHAELGRLVTEGRRKEFQGFAAFADEESIKRIPDPQAESTFNASKLNWAERGEGQHANTLALYKEALRLRREEPSLRRRARDDWQAVALGGEAVAIVYTEPDAGEMCMVVFNLTGGSTGEMGIDEGPEFRLVFSSNETRFGGSGVDGVQRGEPHDAFRAARAAGAQGKGLRMLSNGERRSSASSRAVDGDLRAPLVHSRGMAAKHLTDDVTPLRRSIVP